MPDEPQRLLIAAQSGRALAAAARRAGYAPLVADLYGDLDTLELAQRHVRLPREAAGAIAREGFGTALTALTNGIDPGSVIGIVCGSGFEDRADLLDEAALHAPLLGNRAEIVRGLKDPLRLAKLCQTFEIAHPTITYQPPLDPAGWLVKLAGASGGAHVRLMQPTSGVDSGALPHRGEGDADAIVSQSVGLYFQRRCAGHSVSALFCADGRRAAIIGFSQQWPDPLADAPFRYGGAAGPLEVSPASAAAMTQAVERICRARRLRGLGSADFVLDGDFPWLIEINPRPGATLDIFDDSDVPLLARHIAGCAGVLLAPPAPQPRVRAAAIVYASHAVAAMPALKWPPWCADRQPPHSPLTAGAPVCTVLAEGATPGEARAAAAQRALQIQETLDGNA